MTQASLEVRERGFQLRPRLTPNLRYAFAADSVSCNRLTANSWSIICTQSCHFSRIASLTTLILLSLPVRLNDFDTATLNRIHLNLKHDELDKSTRKAMITQFLNPINEGLEPSNVSTTIWTVSLVSRSTVVR
jgi:hypothetical protein